MPDSFYALSYNWFVKMITLIDITFKMCHSISRYQHEHTGVSLNVWEIKFISYYVLDIS